MEILSDATFKGDVSVNGEIHIHKTAWIYNDAKFCSPVDFYGGASVGGDFNVYLSGGPRLIETNYIDEYGRPYALKVNGSEFVSSDLVVSGQLHANNGLNINNDGLFINSGSIYFNGITITGWSCLNSILSFAKLSTFTSPSIPANCTAFEFTGTAISDSNKTHMIQVQNTSTGKSVIAETWVTANKKPAMSFAGCTSTIAAGTYTALVI